MTGNGPSFLKNVEDLRQAFDQSFAMPAEAPAVDFEDFLGIRVNAHAFALRVVDLNRLEPRRKVVGLPSQRDELLGLTGIQGRLVPVFNLAALLGYRHVPGENCWIAVCGGEEPVGLAFDDFDGYLRVSQADLVGRSEGPARQYVQEAPGGMRPILHLPSILNLIDRRISSQPITGREQE